MMDCEFIATGHYAKIREEMQDVSPKDWMTGKTRAMCFGGLNKRA